MLAALALAASPASLQASPAATDPAPALPAARQEAIDRYLLAEMRRQRVPGLSLGIYRDGWPLYVRGYGVADLEWNVPLAPDTRMQTGSLGKQFVAAAILRLAEQGKLDVDAGVSRFFPEGPAWWRPITLAHLLSHTSGIGVYDTPERSGRGGAFDYRRDFTDDQLAAGIAKLPRAFPVGTDWRYNNANYVLLGILIRRVTGKFYGDWLRTEFFEPLGMRDTRVISDADLIDRRASGYEIKGGTLRNQDWVSPTFNATADGTMYTTTGDMARWDRALGGEAILTAASRKRMWTPMKLANGRPNPEGYGFGWWIGSQNGRRRIEHGGAWQGFTAAMARYPDDRLSVVLFANLDAAHARIEGVAHVVAGMVEPALMPAVAAPRPDPDPARGGRLRDLLARAAAGADLSADHDPAAGYGRDPLDAGEVAAALPAGWRDAPFVLVRDDPGGRRFSYRIGPAGDTRQVRVELAPSGRLLRYAVRPDPDAR